MKIVVVGGQARKVGKTSVVAGIIRGVNSLGWAAVKISHHGGESGLAHGQAAEGLPPGVNFLCHEEKDPEALRDSSRFLAAGARRSFWLRVRDGKLAEALPELFKLLEGNEHVIVESNSIMGLLEPAVFLLVVGESRFEPKQAARLFLSRADALVAVQPASGTSISPGLSPWALEAKPMFSLLAGEWWSAALCRFVRQRLASAGGQEIALGSSSTSRE